MKTIKTLVVLTVLAALPWVVTADQKRPVTLRRKLESEYKLTKTTDDKSDIVTAGSVVVLHKDNVVMVAATTTGNLCTNTYRDGKVSPNKACHIGKVGGSLVKLPGIGGRIPHADKAPTTRTFVSGERFWVTRIDVRDAGEELGVTFDLFTDATPANDQGIRYKGQLTIPFGTSKPTPDEAMKQVAEVITVVPSDDAKETDATRPAPQDGQLDAASQGQPTALSASPSPSEPVPAAIAPPPAPAPDPVEVSEGQTIDQVVTALGPPLNKFKASGKEIYIYKSYKVTFVNGKVEDVE
jgi:hypothetical protein